MFLSTEKSSKSTVCAKTSRASETKRGGTKVVDRVAGEAGAL